MAAQWNEGEFDVCHCWPRKWEWNWCVWLSSSFKNCCRGCSIILCPVLQECTPYPDRLCSLGLCVRITVCGVKLASTFNRHGHEQERKCNVVESHWDLGCFVTVHTLSDALTNWKTILKAWWKLTTINLCHQFSTCALQDKVYFLITTCGALS